MKDMVYMIYEEKVSEESSDGRPFLNVVYATRERALRDLQAQADVLEKHGYSVTWNDPLEVNCDCFAYRRIDGVFRRWIVSEIVID